MFNFMHYQNTLYESSPSIRGITKHGTIVKCEHGQIRVRRAHEQTKKSILRSIDAGVEWEVLAWSFGVHAPASRRADQCVASTLIAVEQSLTGEMHLLMTWICYSEPCNGHKIKHLVWANLQAVPV